MSRFIVLLGWAALQPIFLKAATLDEIEGLVIRKSKTSEALRVGIEKIRELKTHLRACEIQEEERLAPQSCYRALSLAKEIDPEPSIGLSMTEVRRRCREWAEKSSDIEAHNMDHLDAECIEIYRKRVGLNRYKNGHDI